MSLEQHNAFMADEMDKLQMRLKKLRLQKGRFLSTNTKMCNNCKKDFKDSENYNWSCRVHQSQWSGEMWWCCGKTSQNALGCKFSKHIVVREDDEDAEVRELQDSKLQKCMCCKEQGHAIEQCPRDPNVKTRGNYENEVIRLQNL